MDIISEEGYRVDGRMAQELRAVTLRHGHVDGKAFVDLEQGCTKITTCVSGVKERTRQRGKVNLSMAFLGEAQQRYRKNSEKASEMERSIVAIFEQVLLLPENSSVDVDVCVRQDDGSVLSAMINCISLSLCHCGIPMKDVVVGMSIGFAANTFFVDICGAEEGYRYPHMDTALLIYKKKLAHLHMIGKIEHEGFQDMFRHGYEASQRLFAQLRPLLNTTSS